ncbi:MAG: response regulator [Pyrinomonadaceae bacterium]|nr:response regulator [Pyrinomonadaceae bacterium]
MSTETPKPAPTILVVDDVRDSLLMISLTLQSMGLRVLTAENGHNAVEVARLARPDLILMDIHMPELDGLAATRRIREHVELQKIPVVALTAFSTEGFHKAAFDAGLDGYLTKPVDFDRLIKLINSLLERD